MEKQTKILLGLGAVIAAYLILKPKNAGANTQNKTIVTENGYQFVAGSQEEKAFYLATLEKYKLGATPKNNDIINTLYGQYKFTLTKQGAYWTMEQKNPTKDCQVTYWNCGSNPVETIQIPYEANCQDYQQSMPPCAGPPPIYRDFPQMCPDGTITYDNCKPYTPTTSEY
jgi:hypothetical protein